MLIELSRIRTYIRNLEGFRPNPLDDEPIQIFSYITGRYWI